MLGVVQVSGASAKYDQEVGGEPLYALPEHVGPLTAVRGTIFALDWAAFRELGLYDAYAAALPPPQLAAITSVTAGSWVPLELLLGHYRALDGLALDDALVRKVGWSVGERVHGAFLSTLIRLVGKCGVSPWLALEQTYKLWTRSWQGGAVTVHRLGPCCARLTLREVPVCRSHFFCTSFGGAVAAGVAPFGKATQALTLEASRTADSVSYRVTWQP
jgi:hypothetical protein